ncbi:flavodoxin family protein [Acetobacterium wieringae]|uniref:flavodoxin family protein n=1 Tax=Acetobacterium wieringae TaxID=52694 RepID=UPI002B2020F5|nr:flavodoxin [Acetobacterium wieringae]MEA4806705.1 flavodoxin [Acetobacterium wieringae]
MKTAVIYYSLEGNMDFIAQQIGKNAEVDLYRLKPQKEYPTGKISKYVVGGKSAKFGECPELINPAIDLSKYETVIIGTPIWADTLAPPLNTFFRDYDITGKKIVLIATHRGGGADKCFEKMKTHLASNQILGNFDFLEPKQQQDKNINEKLAQISKLIGA